MGFLYKHTKGLYWVLRWRQIKTAATSNQNKIINISIHTCYLSDNNSLSDFFFLCKIFKFLA